MTSFDDSGFVTSTNCENNKAMLQTLEEQVEELYKFRDRYFENHNLEDAINRNSDTKIRLDVVLAQFKQYEGSSMYINYRDDIKCNILESEVKSNCAKYYYLKGRALNVVPSYSKEAEDLLSKAIKLDPKLVEAWNELGESYWKNNKITEAINCFNGALKHRKNKVSLRNLSMLARQENTKSKDEKINNIKKGVQYAKEAVNLDAKDGLSWAVLGNAHLSAFFGIQQNPKTLHECLKAYSQAETDIVAKSTPDLHYNRGVTLKYEQEFKLALESFNKASSYDPLWEPPKQKERELVQYLRDICDFVSTSGKMKAKRLQQMLQSIHSKQLGPYGGGSYTSSSGQTVKLDEIQLSKLKTDINVEKVVLGKVVCSVRNEDTVPFTFCMVDKVGTCVAVTVFNLADGKGVIIGDCVAIPEPFVTDVDFTYKEDHFKFRLLRVQTPLVLVINGKKASRNLQADVQMSLFQKYD